MKTCNKILIWCAFSAAFLSLGLGTLAVFGLGIRPNAVLASVVTAGPFIIMMAVAINCAFKMGQLNADSNAEDSSQ